MITDERLNSSFTFYSSRCSGANVIILFHQREPGSHFFSLSGRDIMQVVLLAAWLTSAGGTVDQHSDWTSLTSRGDESCDLRMKVSFFFFSPFVCVFGTTAETVGRVGRSAAVRGSKKKKKKSALICNYCGIVSRMLSQPVIDLSSMYSLRLIVHLPHV